MTWEETQNEIVGQQELLQIAQSLAGLGCFRWDLSTNDVIWSDELFRIFGIEPGSQNVTLETFLNFVVPEDRKAVQSSIQQAVETLGGFHNTKRINRADGEIRVIESRGRVITDDMGTPTWVVGACQDITEGTKSKESLQWQVDGLQLLSDLSAEILSGEISPKSLDLTFRGLAKHLGCDIYTHFDTVKGRLELALAWGLPQELVDALQRIEFGDQLCGVCAIGSTVMHVPFTQLQSHPQSQDLLPLGVKSFLGSPIILDGKTIGCFSFLSRAKNHFTESEIEFVRTAASLVAALKSKLQSENELRQVEQRQDTVLHTAKTMIWECDPSLRYTFVSGYCVELLGFPREKWLEPGFWESRVHPDDLDAAIAYCSTQTSLLRDHRFEYRMIHQDGAIIWIEDSVKVVVDDGVVTSLRGALVDVTARKRLEQELRQSQKMQAIGRLAGGIAHDFNNVLTVISTYAELMLNQLSTHGKDHTYITAIKEASERAAALTTQLLVFSRKSINQPKSLDLNEIVSQSQTLLRRVIGEDIELSTSLSHKIGKINSDKTHIEQIILNLAINARDAMPSGGNLTLETHDITIDQASSEPDLSPGRYVKLIVADDGCGMSRETQARCFEPFFTTKEVGKGTGLGLSVTYGVVTESGGSISVSSDIDVGTKFNILFPVFDEQSSIPANAHLSYDNDFQSTVLLVEDEQAVRRVARMSLESAGFDVIEAGSGAEALENIEQTDLKIDVLVTDLIMPGMNGQTLATELRRQFHDLRVLYISGYGQSDVSDTIDDDLQHCFLQKPFTAQRLIDAIAKVIMNDPRPFDR